MNAYNISDLVEFFGTKTAIAEALGIRPQAVYQWKTVPPRRALELEKITGGKFTAGDSNCLATAVDARQRVAA